MRPPDLPDWPWETRDGYPAAGLLKQKSPGVWNVYDVSRDFPDTVERKRPRSWIEGGVFHHDGVLFSGTDRNFNGTTFDESIARCRAVYNHAIAMGWKVFPYHFLIDPEGRVFTPRQDVLDTFRAHVAGYNPETGVHFNETWIGICFMGNFADGVDNLGRKIPRQADRPTQAAIDAANDLMQFITNREERRMALHPHKFFARFNTGQEWKPCPGDEWVADLGWSGDPVNPFFYSPSLVLPPDAPDYHVKAITAVENADRAMRTALDELATARRILEERK